MLRDSVVSTTHYLASQALHALRPKWRQKRYHFVDHTTQAPNITLVVIWLFLPDFGAGIVRRARLSLEQSSLRNLGDIEVTKLDHTLLGHEQIGTLDIPVDYFEIMEGLQSSHRLDQEVPDLLLRELCLLLFVLLDCLQQIATVCQLHYDTETSFLVVKEGILVSDDIRMVDGGENSNFIQSILLFLF